MKDLKPIVRRDGGMKQYKVNITITVDLDVIRAIDAKCKEGLTRSAVFEKAINHYLASDSE